MRAGEVVSIRVNPHDCIAVTQLVHEVGAFVPGMSFSSAVAISLSTALKALRDAGVLPPITGFEYNDAMAPFSAKKRSKGKLDITNRIYAEGSEPVVPTITLPKVKVEPPSVLTEDDRLLRERFRDLSVARASRALSAEEEQEYDRCYKYIVSGG